MDYTRYVYDQKRKQKASKKKSSKQDLKEVKFRPNIDKHDFNIKLQHIRGFLEKGHQVKITLRYRAREMRHYELGTELLEQLTHELSDIANVEAERRKSSDARLRSIMLTKKKHSPEKNKPSEQDSEAQAPDRSAT